MHNNSSQVCQAELKEMNEEQGFLMFYHEKFLRDLHGLTFMIGTSFINYYI